MKLSNWRSTSVLAVSLFLSGCGASNSLPKNAAPASGNEAGNGGHGVVCLKPDGTRTVQVLDYYEAKLLMPELVPDMTRGSTDLEKAEAALDRLARVDAPRAERYRAGVKAFYENQRSIQAALLGSTNDYGYIPMEVGCHVEQIVVQRKTPFPEMKRYTVQAALWKELPVEHRAGLILHEVIYGHALELNHTNSMATRYLTALVSSRKLETMSPESFSTVMEVAGLSEQGNAVARPTWVSGTIVLSPCKFGTPYEAMLRPYVRYPADRRLTFQFKTPQTTMKGLHLDAQGRLWTDGVPASEDNLPYQASVQVTAATSDGASADVTLLMRAEPGDPTETLWLTSTLVMPTASERRAFAYFLAPNVNCRHPLFRSNTLPAWMQLTASGQITGTPSPADVGTYEGTVTVDCDGRVADARITGAVNRDPRPPVWIQDPIAFSGTAGVEFMRDVSPFAKDLDGGALGFNKKSGPSWLVISVDGKIFGTPGFSDVGANSFVFTATNGTVTSEVRVSVFVEGPSVGAHWVQAPIRFNVKAGDLFSHSLLGYVSNPQSKPLNFMMVSGPRWLILNGNGSMMGTPTVADLGENTFVVRLWTEEANETANLVLTVTK